MSAHYSDAAGDTQLEITLVAACGPVRQGVPLDSLANQLETGLAVSIPVHWRTLSSSHISSARGSL